MRRDVVQTVCVHPEGARELMDEIDALKAELAIKAARLHAKYDEAVQKECQEYIDLQQGDVILNSADGGAYLRNADGSVSRINVITV